jgi:hypothetical protein
MWSDRATGGLPKIMATSTTTSTPDAAALVVAAQEATTSGTIFWSYRALLYSEGDCYSHNFSCFFVLPYSRWFAIEEFDCGWRRRYVAFKMGGDVLHPIFHQTWLLILYKSAGTMAVLVGHPFDLVKVSVFLRQLHCPVHDFVWF